LVSIIEKRHDGQIKIGWCRWN